MGEGGDGVIEWGRPGRVSLILLSSSMAVVFLLFFRRGNNTRDIEEEDGGGLRFVRKMVALNGTENAENTMLLVRLSESQPD